MSQLNPTYLIKLFDPSDKEIIWHFKPKEARKNGKTSNRIRQARRKKALGLFQNFTAGFSRFFSLCHEKGTGKTNPGRD
jgi:hypothetical protein